MIAIIYTSVDIASITMATILEKMLSEQGIDGVYMYEHNEELIYADNIDKHLPNEVEYIIMLSKHSASSGRPTISVHTPGNLSVHADMGGKPMKVAIANPCLVGSLLRRLYKLVEYEGLNYEVTLEVTHHGPTEVEKPVTFVEIGPNEDVWRDEKAAEIAIRGIISVIREGIGNCVKLVGFGGPHYAPIFVKFLLKEPIYGIGHIVSKYVLTECNTDVVDLVLNRNGGVDRAAINWKGLKGAVRQCIYSYLMDMGIEIIKI